jgi:hypothetical protein
MAEFDVSNYLGELSSPAETKKKKETSAADNVNKFSSMAASGESLGRESTVAHAYSDGKTPKVEGYSYSLKQPIYSTSISNDLSHSENLFGLASTLESHLAAHETAINTGTLHPEAKALANQHINAAYGKLADFYDSNSASQNKHLEGSGYTDTSNESVVPRGRRQIAELTGSEKSLGSIGHMRDAIVHLKGAVGHLKAAATSSNLGIAPEVESVGKQADKEFYNYQKHVDESSSALISGLKNFGTLSTAGSVDEEEISSKPPALRLPVSPQAAKEPRNLELGPRPAQVGKPLYMTAGMRTKEDYKYPAPWTKPSSRRQDDLDADAEKAATERFANRNKRGVPLDTSTPESREAERQTLANKVVGLNTPRPIEPARSAAFVRQQAVASQRSNTIRERAASMQDARLASVKAQEEATRQTVTSHMLAGKHKEAAVLHFNTFGTNRAVAPKRYLKERSLVMSNPVRYLSEQGYDLGERVETAPVRGTTRTGANPNRDVMSSPRVKQTETRKPTTATTSPFTPQAEEEYKAKLAAADAATAGKKTRAQRNNSAFRGEA